VILTAEASDCEVLFGNVDRFGVVQTAEADLLLFWHLSELYFLFAGDAELS